MILFPAIDLKDGQCVRLKLGDMEQATVFNDDPAAPETTTRLPESPRSVVMRPPPCSSSIPILPANWR